ncbi:MAG: hypothetical protein M1336_06080 [Deltaproteobacteria bacterium]|jgi:hypothetical protein|nr:hypothetical protein [Deltaproteobacteria bacterium]
MWKEVLVLAATPDEVRALAGEVAQLAGRLVLLAPAPYRGVSSERYRENYPLIFALFGHEKRPNKHHKCWR